jgi:hypothetical protein
MTTFPRVLIGQTLALLLLLTLPACQAIGTIFETGVWAGVILVVLVIAVVGFVAAMIRRRV